MGDFFMSVFRKYDEEELQIVEEGFSIYNFVKRTVDIVVGVFAFPFFGIIYLLVALIIKIQDGGPVVYKAERVGLNGEKFFMYKFRTMKINAEKLEDFLTPEEIAAYKKEFKLPRDPRVTKVGNILRKTSIDELPQLINVIKGDMSLIGPRPIVEEETEMYGNMKPLFLSVKPGLTGYWQAYARNNVGYTDGRRQEMELYYIKNRSISLDIKIFFATFKRVLLRKGVS